MNLGNNWHVIHSQRFDNELEKLSGNLVRGDDFIKGVTLQLSLDPKSGVKITDFIWYVKTRIDEIQGRIIVYYAFQENPKIIHLLSIKKSKLNEKK